MSLIRPILTRKHLPHVGHLCSVVVVVEAEALAALACLADATFPPWLPPPSVPRFLLDSPKCASSAFWEPFTYSNTPRRVGGGGFRARLCHESAQTPSFLRQHFRRSLICLRCTPTDSCPRWQFTSCSRTPVIWHATNMPRPSNLISLQLSDIYN